MRTTYRLGGICVVLLSILGGGCSSDDEEPGTGGGTANSDGGAEAMADSGARTEAGRDGSAGGAVDGGGRVDAREDAGDGASSVAHEKSDAALAEAGQPDRRAPVGETDAGKDVATTEASTPPVGDAGLDRAELPDAPKPAQDGAADGSKPEGGAVADARTDADARAVLPDAGGGSCRLTAAAGAQCELALPFEKQTVGLDTDLGSLGLTSCPNGADLASGVCVGRAVLTNSGWTASAADDVLEGTIQLRVDDFPTTMSLGVLSATCHLSIGDHAYVPIRVRITLPRGTSAARFVPGCSAVTNPRVTLLDTVPYKVTDTVVCQAGARAASADGGLDSLNKTVEAVIVSALSEQVCIAR